VPYREDTAYGSRLFGRDDPQSVGTDSTSVDHALAHPDRHETAFRTRCHRPGRFATLEMRIDHTDERLELADIHGNGSLKSLAICRLAKLHAMHQVQLL
jgi:hypothetical protein